MFPFRRWSLPYRWQGAGAPKDWSIHFAPLLPAQVCADMGRSSALSIPSWGGYTAHGPQPLFVGERPEWGVWMSHTHWCTGKCICVPQVRWSCSTSLFPSRLPCDSVLTESERVCPT